MPLDGISAHFLTQDLNRQLQGARLQQVVQEDKNTIFLGFRQQQQNLQLAISIDPARSFVYLTHKYPAQRQDLSSFGRLLRQQLMGAELIRCENPIWERIFIFHFRALNEIGDWEERNLIAEIMGKHSNLVLLRPNGVIHDALRHIDHSVNRFREIMPARPYVAPPSQDKIDIKDFQEDLPDYLDGKLVFPFLRTKAAIEISRLLVKTLAGWSPLLAQDQVYRAGLDDKLHPSDLTTEQLLRLSQVIAKTCSRILEAKLEPAIYYQDASHKQIVDFYSLPLAIYPERQTFKQLSTCYETYYNLKLTQSIFAARHQALNSKLDRLARQNQRKRGLHEEDLAEGSQSELYKLYGDLLQAKIYQIAPKATEVEVENYYDPDTAWVTIPLDPSRSPAQNIDNYYRKYRKAKEKHKIAQEFLHQDELNEAWLANLYSLLDQAEDLSDLEAISDELSELGSTSKKELITEVEQKASQANRLNPGKPGKKGKYKARPQQSKQKKKVDTQRPVHDFRKFTTSDGFQVRVGRNNIENDRLTFRKSRKDDLWFHVKNQPGSHTVLHLEGQEASEEAILETAAIAAYYSSANKFSMGAKVEVDYCPIKNVRKIPGAKPGLVNYQDYSTLLVEAKLPDNTRG
ncbi:MAG: NFACT RNA binding domain-containing protein [Eubacteriales bacterium]|nr:NFACT RNA binding domain-containing protein [Eubacteriales bacterium]